MVTKCRTESTNPGPTVGHTKEGCNPTANFRLKEVVRQSFDFESEIGDVAGHHDDIGETEVSHCEQLCPKESFT